MWVFQFLHLPWGGFRQFTPPTLSVSKNRKREGEKKKKITLSPTFASIFGTGRIVCTLLVNLDLEKLLLMFFIDLEKEKGLGERYLPCAFSLQGVQIKGKQINNKRMETKLQKFAKFDKWWPVVATS